VIYGGHDCDAISFEDIPKALAEQGVDIRLFGKPQSFKKRRMGVILSHADDIKQARNKAQQARSQIKTKPV
jgi:phosphoribosylglycinamide formyltransferase 2